jgi:ribulose-5-phosphate 4-epimerase/fuculose-1-phosphate aldolase
LLVFDAPVSRSLCRDKVYIAPSGVQKERIEPEHIFVLPYPQPTPSPHTDRVFLRRPQLNLKESACTPLFWNSFDLRDAGSCVHTHSQHAVMATLLWKGPVFSISHQVSAMINDVLDYPNKYIGGRHCQGTRATKDKKLSFSR